MFSSAGLLFLVVGILFQTEYCMELHSVCLYYLGLLAELGLSVPGSAYVSSSEDITFSLGFFDMRTVRSVSLA